jgi:hypothetical protein
VTDHIKLVTTALRATLNAPLLWFFGLFLSAGFNFNWVYLSRAGFTTSGAKWLTHFWQTSYAKMEQLVPAILLLILVLAVVWIVANWIKTVFIFNAADFLDAKRLGQAAGDLTIWGKQKELFRQGKKVLGSVLALSLFTVVAQAIVVFVLLGPWLWQKYITYLPGMTSLAGLLIVIFALFFSLLNFFSVLFVVLYQKKFHEAFAEATHFMKTKAGPLFATCIILLFFYAVGVLVGVETVAAARFLFFELAAQLSILNLPSGQMIWLPQTISFALLLWLGFLNAFFNIGLFVFFQNNVKPQKFEAEEAALGKLILKVSVDKTL